MTSLTAHRTQFALMMMTSLWAGAAGTNPAAAEIAGNPFPPNTQKPVLEIWDEEIPVMCTLTVAMDGTVLLFKEARDEKRVTVKRSSDGGQTWPIRKLVRKGPGNYTWLAAGRTGTPSEGMIYLASNKDWMARFNMSWVMQDKVPDKSQ